MAAILSNTGVTLLLSAGKLSAPDSTQSLPSFCSSTTFLSESLILSAVTSLALKSAKSGAPTLAGAERGQKTNTANSTCARRIPARI